MLELIWVYPQPNPLHLRRVASNIPSLIKYGMMKHLSLHQVNCRVQNRYQSFRAQDSLNIMPWIRERMRVRWSVGSYRPYVHRWVVNISIDRSDEDYYNEERTKIQSNSTMLKLSYLFDKQSNYQRFKT